MQVKLEKNFEYRAKHLST